MYAIMILDQALTSACLLVVIETLTLCMCFESEIDLAQYYY